IKRTAPACVTPAPPFLASGAGGQSPPTSPALFFLGFGLHDLEGYRLDPLRDGLLAQLLLELFLRLLFGFLVLGLASTRRHRYPPVHPAGSARGRSSIADAARIARTMPARRRAVAPLTTPPGA